MKNSNSMKRAYHHSEAWLKKHAEKLTKKEAKKTSKKEIKKEAIKKPMKRTKKQMAKKLLKKVKKNVEVKKPVRHTMKTAVQLFDQIKWHVSAVKKSTKNVGKFLTEAMKTGDEKYIAKVLKLFGRIGYVYTADNQIVTFENNAKVKLPKVKVSKVEKKDNDKPVVEKNLHIKKQAAAKPVEEPTKPVTFATPLIASVATFEDEAEEIENDFDENAELDEFDDAEELDMTEKREDESDEEFRDRIKEEREIAREQAEAEAEARDEIFAAQDDNGDFS